MRGGRQSSKNYAVIKGMAPGSLASLHLVAGPIWPMRSPPYVPIPIDSAAPGVQLFDSWQASSATSIATSRRPSLPETGVESGEATPLPTPPILYIPAWAGAGSAMGTPGFRCHLVGWTVDIAEALARLPEHPSCAGNVKYPALYCTP